MLDWGKKEQLGPGTSSTRLPNPKRVIFNPLEKMFPRKMTEPLTISKNLGRPDLSPHNSSATLAIKRGRDVLGDSRLGTEIPSSKFPVNMPMSAKQTAQTPIKILVGMGSQLSDHGTPSSRLGRSRDPGDKETADFLIKKPSGIVNLKLKKALNPGSNIRTTSFEQDKVQTVQTPTAKPPSVTKFTGLNPNKRRNSSRGEQTPYMAQELFGPKNSLQPSSSVKQFAPLGGTRTVATSKPKLKISGGVLAAFEKENPFTKNPLPARSAKPFFGSGSLGTASTPLKVASNKTNSTSNDMTGLSSIVTQVNEKDMLELQGPLANNSALEKKPEESLVDVEPARKGTKREYLAGKLPFYIGGVVLFFADTKKDYFATLYKEHFRHTFFSLKFCKGLKAASQSELQAKMKLCPQKDRNKKTLVLDLDETLIHCVTAAGQPADMHLPILFPSGDTIKAPINIRPHAKQFLEAMASLFEVVVFTASNSCYADVVLDHLDPAGALIQYRLYRENCIQLPSGMYVKDLRVISGRDPEGIVLVDNASYSFGFQLDQGIPIIPFYDSKQDSELLSLGRYLERMARSKNPRDLNRKTFRFKEIGDCATVEEAYRLYAVAN